MNPPLKALILVKAAISLKVLEKALPCCDFHFMFQKLATTLQVIHVAGVECDFQRALKHQTLANLREISYTDTRDSLIANSLDAIAISCPNLTKVDFSGCSALKQVDLKLLLEKCDKISEVSLMRINDLDDELFTRLSESMKKDALKTLRIGGKTLQY